MGYATGLDAVLARADDSTVRAIVTSSSGEPRKILEGLAQKDLIRPLITQGHLGDVLPDKIVYDAQTTSGGSGGPVFNPEGKVISLSPGFFSRWRNSTGAYSGLLRHPSLEIFLRTMESTEYLLLTTATSSMIFDPVA